MYSYGIALPSCPNFGRLFCYFFQLTFLIKEIKYSLTIAYEHPLFLDGHDDASATGDCFPPRQAHHVVMMCLR